MTYIDDPPPDAHVLVGIVPHPRDLQIIRDERWYRIPVAHAPRQLAADYLACYQPAAFGEERWAIRYYAPIVRYRVRTRVTLLPHEATHPHAHDLYFVLDLGNLHTLGRPIFAARLRRITFILTTMGQMQQAEDVRDLWHPDEQTWGTVEHLWAGGLAGKSLVTTHYSQADTWE